MRMARCISRLNKDGGAVVYSRYASSRCAARSCVRCRRAPIAFRYDGFLTGDDASPEDLEDFATGFSVRRHHRRFRQPPGDVDFPNDDGITIEVSLNARDLHRYLAGRRVRQLRGNTSCGFVAA